MRRCEEKAVQKYLAACETIDHQHPKVAAKAGQLADGLMSDPLVSDVLVSDEDIAKACFSFVRDEITHSLDYQKNPVTCSASEVLENGTGYCYAKSHLLVALLRANSIPAGLCYQRLTIDHDRPPFSLHGLVAVHLQKYGWYRIDPHGNKPGVQAEFCPPLEKLAFPIVIDGEADLPEIWPQPLELVVTALKQGLNYRDVADNLPDIELFGAA